MIEMSSEKVAALVRSQAALGPVCNELARLDLEAMVGSSGFRVTARELAVRWGWSKSVVGRWLRQLDRFELAASPSGSRIRRVGEARDSHGTPAGQTKLGEQETFTSSRDTSGTHPGHPRDAVPGEGQPKPWQHVTSESLRDTVPSPPPSPSPPSPKGDGSPPSSPPDRQRRTSRDEMRQVAEAWRAAAGREPSRPISRRLRQLQAGYVGTLNGSGVATLERDIGEAFRHFAGKPPRYVLACLEGRVDQGDFGKPWRRHTSTGHTIQRAAGRRSFAEISE